MIKVFCLLFIYAIFGNALDRAAEVTWGSIKKGRDYSGVTISELSKDKTDLTWNESVTDELNSLRATFYYTLTDPNVTESCGIKNLCKPLRKGSIEESAQTYILQTLGKTSSCPIKKDKRVTYIIPYTYFYTRNTNHGCGPFRAEFKLFEESDTDDAQPILTNTFGGNITGC